MCDVKDEKFRDFETMSLKEMISYIIETIDDCENRKNIMAAFECSFRLKGRLLLYIKDIEHALQIQGYNVSYYHETFPREDGSHTPPFNYVLIKKL